MPNAGARAVVLVAVAAAAFLAGYLIGRGEAPVAPPRGAAPRISGEPPRGETRTPPRRRAESVPEEPEGPARGPRSADPDEPSESPEAIPDAAPDTTPDVAEGRVRVRGRCVDRAGQVLPLVRVVGPRGAPVAHSDRDGRFELDVLVASGSYVRLFPDRRPLAPVRADLRGATEGVVELGDVLFDAGDTFRGRFLDAAGNPIAGARVHLVSRELEGVIVGEVVATDAEGRFAIGHAGPGTYDLGLLRPGFDLDGGDLTDIVYDVRASEEVVVRAVRDRFIHVQFKGDAGRAVRFGGGRVTWFALDDASDRLDWWGLGGEWDHFHIAARPGATYEVRIDLDGFEPATIRATATEARDTRAEAVLRPKAR